MTITINSNFVKQHTEYRLSKVSAKNTRSTLFESSFIYMCGSESCNEHHGQMCADQVAEQSNEICRST